MKKGRRDRHSSFVALERKILFKCAGWRKLSLRAKVLYIHLKGKFNTLNNGFIQLHFSEMKDMPGFTSRRAFYGAKDELIREGWIEQTNPGGLYRNPNCYRLTGRYDDML